MTDIVTLETVEAVRAWTAAHHAEGRRVGLVPTMGYLHDGHLSLVRACAAHADVVLMSIFVNPTQFGPNEDLDRYPRDPDGDTAKARSAGCAAVFIPPVEAMYPAGHATTVHVDGVTGPLCGGFRPGHFDGVCTIVLKLFNLTRCDVAAFGEKDYQQLATIRRMVRDLDVPVQIVPGPIVREADGLAMSSRNVYLSADERARGLSLRRGLLAARAAWGAGERDPVVIARTAREIVEAAAPTRIDYVDALDAETLRSVDAPAARGLVVAAAAYFGGTRLIDNIVLEAST